MANLFDFKYHGLFMGHILVVIVARLLEGMFVVGSTGSFVVLVLSGIEDLKTLFGREEKSRS